MKKIIYNLVLCLTLLGINNLVGVINNTRSVQYSSLGGRMIYWPHNSNQPTMRTSPRDPGVALVIEQEIHSPEKNSDRRYNQWRRSQHKRYGSYDYQMPNEGMPLNFDSHTY